MLIHMEWLKRCLENSYNSITINHIKNHLRYSALTKVDLLNLIFFENPPKFEGDSTNYRPLILLENVIGNFAGSIAEKFH